MKKNVFILLALCLTLLAPVSCSRKSSAGGENAPGTVGKTVGDILAERSFADPELFVDGVGYARKKDITAVLFMGIDKAGDLEVADTGIGGQCDVLLLLVNDGEDKKQTILQIDRDTLAEVEILDANGNQTGYSRTQQICFSHTYGKGDEKSCENTVRAVSRLLGDIPVDGYVSVLYEGVPPLNDLIGGVTVTVTDDLTHADPSLKAGSTVTLKGSQSLAFIRSRMTVADGTNRNRMSRHRTYLNAFSAKIRTMMKERPAVINDLYAAAEPYMVTDLSVGRVSSIALEGADYENGGIVVPEGEYTEAVYPNGKSYVEFHADADSLFETVLALFYKPVTQ